ncbi:TIL domain-containing protein [Trichonephila clavipes]|nr:TIL domain-containing protein [Trichonephila clavipes]
MIAYLTDCEENSVIRFLFLNAKNVKPVEIHCQLVEVYDENVTSDEMVRMWERHFNDGCTNVHDEAGGSECPSNQHQETCATYCPITCKNRDNPPEVCPAVCFNGCVCNKGYIKKTDKNGPCVKPSECPN